MSFPATYNINYYMGDTHEFRVYPKDSSGAPFPLAQYTGVKFTIAERRGIPLPEDQEPVEGYAAFSNDKTYILCAITPDNAADLNASKPYVYDVQISKADTPYDFIFTLLTGDIRIRDQVTLASATAAIQAPGPVIAVTPGNITETSIQVSWSIPVTGGIPSGYLAYITPYSPTYENTIALSQLVSALALATPTPVSGTSTTFTSTTAIPSLGIPSLPLSAGTAYIYAIVATNAAGSSSPTGNFNVSTGNIDEVFTAGGS
jgi:hypothetical protein